MRHTISTVGSAEMIVKAAARVLNTGTRESPSVETLVEFTLKDEVLRVEVADPIHYALMDGKAVKYFYAHIDEETAELVIDGEAPKEDW